jgi:hypothetical protein
MVGAAFSTYNLDELEKLRLNNPMDFRLEKYSSFCICL